MNWKKNKRRKTRRRKRKERKERKETRNERETEKRDKEKLKTIRRETRKQINSFLIMKEENKRQLTYNKMLKTRNLFKKIKLDLIQRDKRKKGDMECNVNQNNNQYFYK